jgi:hypothetical protein
VLRIHNGAELADNMWRIVETDCDAQRLKNYENFFNIIIFY